MLRITNISATPATRPATAGFATSAREKWEAALAPMLEKYNGDRVRAVWQLVHDRPDLRDALNAELNAGRGLGRRE